MKSRTPEQHHRKLAQGCLETISFTLFPTIALFFLRSWFDIAKNDTESNEFVANQFKFDNLSNIAEQDIQSDLNDIELGDNIHE